MPSGKDIIDMGEYIVSNWTIVKDNAKLFAFFGLFVAVIVALCMRNCGKRKAMGKDNTAELESQLVAKESEIAELKSQLAAKESKIRELEEKIGLLCTEGYGAGEAIADALKSDLSQQNGIIKKIVSTKR